MHGTYGNGSDTCYRRGAANAKKEGITKGGDSFYVQNKFLTKLKTDVKKIAHSQKLAINESSTIFVVSSWNLVKISTSWVDNIDQVSWR